MSASQKLEQMQQQKKWIDTLFTKSSRSLLVFSKRVGAAIPEQVTNTQFPEAVETTYNILKDSAGNIITISEFPYSESGDWHIAYTYYFDVIGKTFAFERQTNFFNSICTPGVAYETKTFYYDSTFRQISYSYSLVDEKKMPLIKDSCQFPYDHAYQIVGSLQDFLAKNKLNLPK